MSKTSGGQVCVVRNCRNTSLKCNHSFFSFPTDIERTRIWAIACNREDLLEKLESHPRSFRLCGIHFEKRMFLNNLQNRLQPHAVPTIFPALVESAKELSDHNYSCFIASVTTFSDDQIRTDFLEKDYRSPTEWEITEEANNFQNIIVSGPEEIEYGDASPDQSREIIPYIYEERSVFSIASTQTSAILSSQSPRKEKLRQKVKALHRERRNLKKELDALKQKEKSYLQHITIEEYKQLTYKFCPTKELADFINTQISQAQTRPKGRYIFDTL